MSTVTLEKPTPAVQLRERLEAARRADLPFDVAWARAWGRIRWDHDTTKRRAWKKALAATRDAWEAAYDGDLERQDHGVLSRVA